MVEKGQGLSLPEEESQKTAVFKTALELVAGLRGLVDAGLWTSSLVTVSVKGLSLSSQTRWSCSIVSSPVNP
jgi:hypothetical protein